MLRSTSSKFGSVFGWNDSFKASMYDHNAQEKPVDCITLCFTMNGQSVDIRFTTAEWQSFVDSAISLMDADSEL